MVTHIDPMPEPISVLKPRMVRFSVLNSSSLNGEVIRMTGIIVSTRRNSNASSPE